jgi:hypothetical protein
VASEYRYRRMVVDYFVIPAGLQDENAEPTRQPPPPAQQESMPGLGATEGREQPEISSGRQQREVEVRVGSRLEEGSAVFVEIERERRIELHLLGHLPKRREATQDLEAAAPRVTGQLQLEQLREEAIAQLVKEALDAQPDAGSLRR